MSVMCSLTRKKKTSIDISNVVQFENTAYISIYYILGPLLFLVFVNDLAWNLECPCFMFADDIKILGNPSCDALQRDLDKISKWSIDWDMPINPKKSYHLIQNLIGPTRTLLTPTGRSDIAKVDEVADLGVTVTADFSPSAQCAKAVATSRRASHRLRHIVASREPAVFIPLYKAFVRPFLEYCVQAWCPYLKRDIKSLEQVQKLATRYLVGMRGLTYDHRLEALDLFSLERRRLRGDLIEAFKMLRMSGSADQCSIFQLRQNPTLRGHEWTLFKRRCTVRLRACSYAERVVDSLNRLPSVIVAAPSVTAFIARPDHLWSTYFPYLK